MAFSNYGDLKTELSAKLFHSRFLAQYDGFTQLFEASANARLRVRQMEAVASLTTSSGEVALPTDYLLWRTILPTTITTYPWREELEYVHPAFLPATTGTAGYPPRLFTIEGNTLKIRPIDDVNAYEFHYYRKIPTLIGDNSNTNWLLGAYPNAYLFGLMTEAMAHGRNAEGAQLYKARRDEIFAEITQLSALTTGATSQSVRTAEYF
jgi:hypothetical protein